MSAYGTYLINNSVCFIDGHCYFVAGVTSIFFGNTRFNIIETINTTATQFSANTVSTIFGKMEKISGTCVKPIPILNESAAIVIFLCVYPHFPIICKPLTTMLPNIISVQPPRTASGRVASNEPKNGKMPASSIITAPAAIANLLTTLVIATRPTFWLNEVIGRQPNIDDNALIKPSQAIEPDVSLRVTSRFNPEAANADVSPIVSVADTKKINVTEIIALILNSGLKGIIDGNAINEVFCNAEKSIIPIQAATI